jgi:glycosyltransferase involved in cell wall biosynthesis
MCEAIDSALAQTYKNCEVLVINDGSDDNGETEKIALSYGDKIRYFSKSNGGVATALNMGIKKMRGEYFSWLSHDDIYLPEKVAKQISRLSNENDKTILITCPYIIEENGVEVFRTNPFGLYTEEELSRPLFALLRGHINGCSLLVHKKHFEQHGDFDPSRPTTQDFALWFKIMRKNRLCIIKEALVISRSHEAQGSKAMIKEHIIECNALWIDFVNELSESEKCAMDGSVYDFYRKTYDFLSSACSYDRAIPYIEGCMIRALGEMHINAKERQLCHLKIEVGKLISLDSEVFFDDSLAALLTKKKQMPRIMFFAGDLADKGGLNRVLFGVASHLCEKYEVIIVTDVPLIGESLKIDSRIKILRVYEYREFSMKLAKICCLLSVDIYINSHNCWAERVDIFDWLDLYQIKSIAWNHEDYFLPYWNPVFHTSLLDRNERFKKASVCVWLTSPSAFTYSAFCDNAAVMPNSTQFDGKRVLTKNRIQETGKDIISVARFDDPRKGLALLLYTFANILKKIKDVKLFVVGSYNLGLTVPENPEKTYRDLIEELKIPKENLIFTGVVSDTSEYYQRARVHLLPSYYEGFGLVILEAAEYGVPSVVFDGSGYRDIIDDGNNGFIVPRGDIKAMSSITLSLLENDAFHKQASTNLRNLVDRFKPSVIYKRWDKLIEYTLSLDNEELRSVLKDEFMPAERHESIVYKNAFHEYEDAVQRLLIGKMRNNEAVLDCPQVKQYQDNLDIKELIQGTHELVSNLHEIYSELFARATQIQGVVPADVSIAQAVEEIPECDLQHHDTPTQADGELPECDLHQHDVPTQADGELPECDLHQHDVPDQAAEEIPESDLQTHDIPICTLPPHSTKKRPLRRLLVRTARTIYRPMKKIVTAIRLKPAIQSMKIYKKLYDRGIISKLNERS